MQRDRNVCRKDKLLAVVLLAVSAAIFVWCGGVMRGCSNDIDRSLGGAQEPTYKWWAW